jgi:hypothetical protein
LPGDAQVQVGPRRVDERLGDDAHRLEAALDAVAADLDGPRGFIVAVEREDDADRAHLPEHVHEAVADHAHIAHTMEGRLGLDVHGAGHVMARAIAKEVSGDRDAGAVGDATPGGSRSDARRRSRDGDVLLWCRPETSRSTDVDAVALEGAKRQLHAHSRGAHTARR